MVMKREGMKRYRDMLISRKNIRRGRYSSGFLLLQQVVCSDFVMSFG